MSSLPPHAPRFRPIPLPNVPERRYTDGQLTPLTPQPNVLLQGQQIHEILQPREALAPTDAGTAGGSVTTSETAEGSGNLESPGNVGLPFLYYDFKDPTSNIIFEETTSLLDLDRGYGDGDGNAVNALPVALSPRLLKLIPATKPNLKQLRILLPTTTPISVIVSNSHFVSILDILDAIYSTLHAPISSSVGDDLDLPNTIYDLRPMPSEETAPTGSVTSPTLPPPPPEPPFRGNSYDYSPFEVPSNSPRDMDSSSSASGRKIDYLEGRTTFVGLTRCPAVEGFGPITWKLHTA